MEIVNNLNVLKLVKKKREYNSSNKNFKIVINTKLYKLKVLTSYKKKD